MHRQITRAFDGGEVARLAVVGHARQEVGQQCLPAGAAGGNLQGAEVAGLEAEFGYQMNMDDWMWMIDDKTLANRTTMSKLGVTFAEITIFFRKR